MNSKQKFITLLNCLIGGLISCSCDNNSTLNTSGSQEVNCIDQTITSRMELIGPKMKEVTETIPLTGSIESNPERVLNVVSLAGGIISNTYFSLGDNVEKGQILAELRSTELSDLYAQFQTIASQIQVAENKLKASQSMFDDGISSQKELMETQSDLDILKAEQEKIHANLSLFSASTEKGIFQVKAPNSGIITSKSIAAGSQISAGGDPLFTISDLSEVWIMVNIYASSIQHITVGMDVAIKTLSYPGETNTGKVAAISQVLDAEAKVLKARVVLQNTDLKLKPGMLVDVVAQKMTHEEAISIPTTAMVFDNNNNFVVVYKDDCDMEIRQINILAISEGITFLSKGLDENDKIISKNQLLVYEQIKNFQN